MKFILVLILMVFFYSIQKKIYRKYCFTGCEADLEFQDDSIFEGGTTCLYQEIVNRKRLPLWWIHSQFLLSRYLGIDKSEAKISEGVGRSVRNVFTLRGYEKVRKSYEVKGLKRGYYRIESMDLITGDIFSTSRFIKTFPVRKELYVYPALMEQEEMEPEVKQMIGDIVVRRHLLEDPFYIRGIRDYVTTDHFKKINWTATAKTGALKVNQFNFTAFQEILILFNTEFYLTRNLDSFLERCISLVATLACGWIQQSIPVGLETTGIDSETGGNITIPKRNGLNQIDIFLKHLARMKDGKVRSIEEVLAAESIKRDKQQKIVLISQNDGKNIPAQVADAKLHGLNIDWIIPAEADLAMKTDCPGNAKIWKFL